MSENWVKYEGEFANDAKSGQGTLELYNGEKYVGEFKEDMIHGKGEFYAVDGSSIIKGEWRENQFHVSH